MAEAVSLKLPASRASAVTVTVAVWPTASEPTENVTRLPDCAMLPWLLVAETYFKLGSSVSVRTTLVVLVGPALVTVTLNVTLLPSVPELGPLLVTMRSAADPTIPPVNDTGAEEMPLATTVRE